MSTPGIRKALKALGSRRRANVNRVAAGKKPILAGKQVTLGTFNKKTGAGLNKTVAKQRQRQQRRK
jgi:hypothetical protein